MFYKKSKKNNFTKIKIRCDISIEEKNIQKILIYVQHVFVYC